MVYVVAGVLANGRVGCGDMVYVMGLKAIEIGGGYGVVRMELEVFLRSKAPSKASAPECQNKDGQRSLLHFHGHGDIRSRTEHAAVEQSVKVILTMARQWKVC
ncbi:hypothetical protein Ancab_012220 [Ancistrocladus abbreviatus]